MWNIRIDTTHTWHHNPSNDILQQQFFTVTEWNESKQLPHWHLTFILAYIFFVSMDRVYVRTCVYAKQFQNFGRFVDNFSGQILLKLQKNLPLAKLLIYPLSLCRFLVCCYTVNFCIFSNFLQFLCFCQHLQQLYIFLFFFCWCLTWFTFINLVFINFLYF